VSLIDDDAGATQTNDSESLVRAVEQLGSRMERVRQAVGQVIFGQGEVVEQKLSRHDLCVERWSRHR